MANPEHVELVGRGAEAIAQWRRRHRGERLDLSGANLAGVNVSEADLRGANLSEARLGEANLWRAKLGNADLSRATLFRAAPFNADFKGATLVQADLSWATLQGADFAKADLTQADLTSSNLTGANFRGATLAEVDLTGAHLTKADFAQADLQKAYLSYTSFSEVDLSQAEGLSAVNHLSPSSIGVDTLMASFRGAGNKLTPELRTFFSGAGVPQELLDALPKIVSEIRYYTCFISYGQPDLKFAEKLREDLKGRGVDCWLYEKDKTVGKRTGHEIVIERRGAEKMVVLCSAKALIRDRFLEEIEDQINEEPNKMVPISLDDLWKEPGFRVMRGTSDLKPFLLDKNYADFANKSYDVALEELLRGLKRPYIEREAAST
jgi:uncharacterized protein YjbI with pentapeptide repeats